MYTKRIKAVKHVFSKLPLIFKSLGFGLKTNVDTHKQGLQRGGGGHSTFLVEVCHAGFKMGVLRTKIWKNLGLES